MKFTFVDLFAGIGGFHLAASRSGGRCVFAAEFDADAREVYCRNFSAHNRELFANGSFARDITEVDERKVPPFDFLFAGFPCQPFSKGGYRLGFRDTRGTLFYDVARIIKRGKPKCVLLENVQNLASHDGGKTFGTIKRVLGQLGYATPKDPLILSPDNFGISVIRKRLFIPAVRRDLAPSGDLAAQFRYPDAPGSKHSIYPLVDKVRVGRKYYISEYEKKVLALWDEFYRGIDIKVVGFPIWADEFKGSGVPAGLPHWKRGFILKNQQLYQRNKRFIDGWRKRHGQLKWLRPTHRKLEWQAGEDIKSIYGGLIQFRPSGVRVKRPDKFSTLVAMVHHQIVGKYMRRLTPQETMRLQSFPSSFKLHPNDSVAFKQLGNAVNVEVVSKLILKMQDYVR